MRYLNRYRILLQRNIERLPNVAKIIATSVTVLLLLFLYPNNTKFKYEFREGQPWIYENLVSPFDFAIKKSDTEIDAEKLKLTQNIQPFFVKNDSLNEVILKHYQQYFYSVLKNENVAVNKDASLIFQNGKSMLQRALDQGIVESNFINFEKNDYINIYDAGDTYKEKYGKLLHKHTFLEDVKKDNNGSENDNQFLYNVFEHAIQPNILYSDSLTTAYKKSILEKIAIYNGLIIKGEVIVSKGELVTPATVQRLNSYKEQYESESNAHKANKWVYVGYFVLTALLLTIFSLYIYYKQPAIWRNTNQYILLLVILLIMCYLTYAIETSRQISIYLLPFCIVPIIVKQLFTVTLALFMHVIIILTASLITQSSFDFIFMQLATGVVASIALYNSRFWSGFLLTIIFIFLTYIAAYFGLSLIKNTGINFIDWSFISWILINVTLTLLASPLIPIMERLIGKISSVVLMELSDINSPLLKELSIKAPGTFQHSLQVAHLAEAAASEIGANARLVRVGALYHDIGKIKKPKFFIENQRRSDNPHDTISYTE
ncbi:MAG: HDIG domain-containing metalloprotein, partial [Saprospiraceae bacterium]